MYVLYGYDSIFNGHSYMHIASKGFWTEILGIGDFYYELAVQIIEICFSMRAETGGLLEMNLLISKLKVMRGNKSEITVEDVERSIRTLEPLGSGYEIIKLNSRTFIQSVPREFSRDQSQILKKASELNGRINYEILFKNESLTLTWTEERFETTVMSLLSEGLIWVDTKTKSGKCDYWIASFSSCL